MRINGRWNIYWLNPDLGWELWEANVSYARAMAFKLVHHARIEPIKYGKRYCVRHQPRKTEQQP